MAVPHTPTRRHLAEAWAIRIAPGIVAGRYQYQTRAYTKFKQLRRPVPQDLFDAA
jgi:hypothetical protein